MGIKHPATKSSGETGYATEWNEEHIIDSDINFNNFSGINLGEPISPSDIATKNYVDSQAIVGVQAPIGSISAWLKNLAGTPSLPTGWVECNGQTLSDAGSPYNGQVIPNLNGGNRFLRGASTSGGVGGVTTRTATLGRTGQQMGLRDSHAVIDGGGHLRTTSQWTVGATNYPLVTPSTGSFSIIPPYYNVVWIMKVKKLVGDSISRNLFSTTFSVGANTNTSRVFSHGLGAVPSYVFCTIQATPAVGGGGPGIHYQIQSVTSSSIEVRIYNPTAFAGSGKIYLEAIP